MDAFTYLMLLLVIVVILLALGRWGNES